MSQPVTRYWVQVRHRIEDVGETSQLILREFAKDPRPDRSFERMTSCDNYDALARQAVEMAKTVMMLCEKHGHTDYASYQQAQAIIKQHGGE